MKFLKLEIRNINSIAEAEIDFENLLGKDEHIFLIWGPSGAGKTTILDAICLSLFKKIPRFEGAAEKKDNKYIDKEFQFSESKGREISTNDIRQFLKRGTKEGSCRLTFEGNDKKQYVAQIKFSINKKNTLSDTEWTLQTPNAILDKNRDIEPEILRITGLNYDQFCRTTLLAQGEFTKFMKSDQNAKAEILEKLTDTAIFSEIGRRIFEKHREKEADFKNLQARNENIERLTDEQIEAFNEGIASLREEIAAIEKDSEVISEKKNWFDNNVKLQTVADNSLKELSSAKEKASSEEVVNSEKIIRLWESTETQRNMFSELIECDKKSEKYKSEENRYLSEFGELTAGNNFIQKMVDDLGKSIENLQIEKAKYELNKSLLENSVLIIDKLSSYGNLKTKLEQYKKKRDENAAKIEERGTEVKKYERLIQEFAKTLSDNAETLSKVKNEYESYGYEQLVKEESSLKSLSGVLQEIKKSAATLQENNRKIEEQNKQIKECQGVIEDKNKALKESQEALVSATKAKEAAQDCYNAALNSVNKFARQMRATLKIGDNCPVCGNEITKILTNEAVDASVASLKARLDECESKEADLKKACVDLKNSLIANETKMNGCKGIIAQLTAIKNQQLSEMQGKCNVVGLALDKSLLPNVDSKTLEIEKAIGSVGEKLQKCALLKKEIDSITAKIEEKKKEQKAAEENKHVSELKYQELVTAQSSLNVQIEDEGRNLKSLVDELSVKLDKTYPEWVEKPSQIAKTVEADAKRNAEIVENIAEKDKERTTLAGNIQRFRVFENRVADLFGWKVSNNLRQCENNEVRWNAIVEKCSVLSAGMTGNEKRSSELRAELDKFFDGNEEIDEEMLRHLVATGYEEIDMKRKEVADLQAAVHQAEARWKMADGNLRQHIEAKPQMEDGDNPDTLGAKLEDARKLRDEKLQEVAKSEEKLDVDAKNKKKYAEALAMLDEKKRELDKWEQLKYLYGDSEGKKFRRIAQSFILQRLIDSTNYFLGKFSDRYQLVKGHDLLILVNDRYLNGCIRPLDTVSGGESFIISIALALGLSNMAMQASAPDFIFIDEGISQLDGMRCDNVVATLQQLHSIINCNIGIVSHLDKLAEMIPTKINVFPVSQGTSRVTVARG